MNGISRAIEEARDMPYASALSLISKYEMDEQIMMNLSPEHNPMATLVLLHLFAQQNIMSALYWKQFLTTMPNQFLLNHHKHILAILSMYLSTNHHNDFLPVLQEFIERIESMGIRHLTSAHALLLACCFSTAAYSDALCLLERETLTLDPDKTWLNGGHLLDFFWYACLIAEKAERYALSREFATLFISVPGQLPEKSNIMLEKYMILSVITNHPWNAFPKHMNSAYIAKCMSRTSSKSVEYLEVLLGERSRATRPMDLDCNDRSMPPYAMSWKTLCTDHCGIEEILFSHFQKNGNDKLVCTMLFARFAQLVRKALKPYVALTFEQFSNVCDGLMALEDVESAVFYLINHLNFSASIDALHQCIYISHPSSSPMCSQPIKRTVAQSKHLETILRKMNLKYPGHAIKM